MKYEQCRRGRGVLFLFLLTLVVSLSACKAPQISAGTNQDPQAVPAEPNLETPFVSYLELSGLSEETLAACTQTIDKDSQQDDVTIHVTQTIGDGMTLYVAFTVTYPETIDLNDPTTFPMEREDGRHYSMIEAKLVEKTDAAKASELGISGIQYNATPITSNMLSYIVSFTYDKDVLSGKEVTLSLTDYVVSGKSQEVSWTVENAAEFRYVDLKNESGKMVGAAILSPFGMNIDVWDTEIVNWEQIEGEVALLDTEGIPIELGMVVGSEKPHIQTQFYQPVSLENVQAIRVGTCTTAIH